MPDPRHPERWPRRILLAVTGLSPQVVTETLYALAVRRDPPFVPTEIALVTTRKGAEHVRLDLLSQEPGWFHRLRRDYDLPEIAFDESRIHVIRDAAGRPADDIRTPADNEAAADFIAETVRSLTTDPDSALHVSIAGGRKTMGYYLGYALSLFGRPQDRLSHVLVTPPFESHPQFFYPTPEQRIIHSLDRHSTPLDCSQAEVTLAEIPFVSLRHGFDDRLLRGKIHFSEAVAAARRALGPPSLVLDLAGRKIRAADQIVPLAPARLALLSLFARRVLAGEPPLAGPPKHVPDSQWAECFLAEYRRIRDNEMDGCDATEQALRDGMDGDYLYQAVSKLNRCLEEALGAAAEPYKVKHDSRGYHLDLPRKAVRYAAIGENPDGEEAS